MLVAPKDILHADDGGGSRVNDLYYHERHHGCAEGYSSLEIIEEAKHVYLFEQDEQWLEAIRATFEPWQDKVTIVQKYVSDHNSSREQTLDDFFNNQTNEHLFLKMDIEGAEPNGTHWPDAITYSKIARSWILPFAHTICVMTKKLSLHFWTNITAHILIKKGFSGIKSAV